MESVRVLVLLGSILSALAGSILVVETLSGSLRGSQEATDDSTPYYSFKGIRYAKAPVKDLRFKVRHFYRVD